jgi:hypothetical protein
MALAGGGAAPAEPEKALFPAPGGRGLAENESLASLPKSEERSKDSAKSQAEMASAVYQLNVLLGVRALQAGCFRGFTQPPSLAPEVVVVAWCWRGARLFSACSAANKQD